MPYVLPVYNHFLSCREGGILRLGHRSPNGFSGGPLIASAVPRVARNEECVCLLAHLSRAWVNQTTSIQWRPFPPSLVCRSCSGGRSGIEGRVACLVDRSVNPNTLIMSASPVSSSESISVTAVRAWTKLRF
ncbi:hypothetical protein TNCV_397451 [Trichonephila clavipes]|nr:hypothetical protein TNCV_397451 [Trichonephila clavipes]